MNPLLDKLQPYPFEKLRRLLAHSQPDAARHPISLGIGEPKHPTPPFIRQALAESLDGLAVYPSTPGADPLRGAIAGWLTTRAQPGLLPQDIASKNLISQVRDHMSRQGLGLDWHQTTSFRPSFMKSSNLADQPE